VFLVSAFALTAASTKTFVGMNLGSSILQNLVQVRGAINKEVNYLISKQMEFSYLYFLQRGTYSYLSKSMGVVLCLIMLILLFFYSKKFT
jgi:hypothetical protein